MEYGAVTIPFPIPHGPIGEVEQGETHCAK